MEFTAYYRVSTARQGQSGLGLEAQREAVVRFTGQPPVSEFTEIESGKRHENRPQLKAAMDDCKRHHRRLVIAKLDRLTRDPDFVGELYRGGVDFVAADNPHATKITVRILAAIAEHEREMISSRIKAALGVRKGQLALEGKKLGAPNCRDTIGQARAAKKRATPPVQVLELMVQARQEKRSFWKIAEQLNGLGVRTGTGSRWYASSVRAQLQAHLPKPCEKAATSQPASPPQRAESPSASPPRPMRPNGIPMTPVQHAMWMERRITQTRR